MSLKQISFIIAVLLFLSCGSTKQAINNSPEPKPKTEEQNIIIKEDIEIEKNTENKSEVDEKTEIEIESTIQVIDEQAPEEIISTEESTTSINHSTWNALLQKHVSSNGNVNYKGLNSDRVKFYSYIEELQNNIPDDSWSRNEKLAYWINAYNAFTIDLILRNYPIKSIKDLKNPWDQRLWKIGGKWYTLNDIEHQILRKMNEPRIHFAIVCASISCPKLQNHAFDGWKLSEQLTNATKEFLSDTSKNIISENSVELSKIFKWFSKDFKSKDSSLIDFLNRYTDIDISQNAKKSFLDYNWNLND